MKKKSKNITESLEKNEFWYHSNHHKIISHFDAKLDKLKGLASEKEKIVRQLQGLLRNNMDTCNSKFICQVFFFIFSSWSFSTLVLNTGRLLKFVTIQII